MEDDLIPGYRILRKLGHGAFAQVYLAMQRSLNREIALKVMNPSMASDKDLCERFIAEARVVASLRHRSIVSIHDVGKHEDNYYISMELIEGSTLAMAIQRQELPAPVLTIIRQIAAALGCAHERGIVHRDVKPGNILLDSDGTAILTDFGIAKNLASDDQLTVVGSIIGTAAYMSPEQVSALEDIDGRSDVYSLGIVLYEMLTGRPPFRGKDHFTTALMHLNKAIPRLPKAHRGFQKLLDRMLAKDRDERFLSAAELVAFIDRMDEPPALPMGGVADHRPSDQAPDEQPDDGTMLRHNDAATRRLPEAVEHDVRDRQSEASTRVVPHRRDSDPDGRTPDRESYRKRDGDARRRRARRSVRVRWPLIGGALVAVVGALLVVVLLVREGNDTPGRGADSESTADSPGQAADSLPARDSLPRTTLPAAQPDAETQWRIDNLLTAAKMHELVGRIMDPPGANAVEAYRDVLAIDPGNRQALEALERLESQ